MAQDENSPVAQSNIMSGNEMVHQYCDEGLAMRDSTFINVDR
jgi:hypothetical protein